MKNHHFKYSTMALLLAAALSACGGGGGSPGTVGGGTGSGTTPGTGTGTTPGTGTGTTPGTVAEPKVTITLSDGTGATVNSLSGGQVGSLKAAVLGADGKAAPNVIVTFAASSELVDFTPETGSALTNADGVATISVKPESPTAAGAVSITATSVIEGKTATSTTNISIGAAPLTVGAVKFSPEPTGRLPAFNTLSLNFPVTSAGQPASAVTGLTMTSLCTGDGSATLVAGAYANGVQNATYTNNGCLRGRDTITIAVGSSSQTISVDVDPANIGNIQFAGSSISGSSIVLKGSGGQGRSEAAQLTFRVVDQQNNGLAGVDVDFTATTNTGGLTISPTRATTDTNGNVTTMVTSGTIPTPVRVIAEASRNGIKISGLSDALTISTGLPIQKAMSMSASRFNIEGMNVDNDTTSLTVLMADQYGNPVSDGTTVNFVTEGGAVGTSAQGACLTTNGGCTVSLRSQNPRPANGRVTVLAYAQGVENFVDLNGDGQYSCSGWTGTTPYRPLVDTCPSGGEPFPANDGSGISGDMGDPFLDTDRNGVYEAAKGDLPFPYNRGSYSAAGDGKWGLNYIRSSYEIVFSRSYAQLVRQVCDNASGVCRDWTTADGDPYLIKGVARTGCSAQPLRFRLSDGNRNPMPQGTTVTANANKLSTSGFAPATVPSTTDVDGTFHGVTVRPHEFCESGDVVVNVTTLHGYVTSYTFKSE